MGRPPHIFESADARWADRTSGPGDAPPAVRRTRTPRRRLWAAGAVALAWAVIVGVGILVWNAAA